MKKTLFAIILCVLFGAIDVWAKDYDIKQTKLCQENLRCDLNNNLLTGTVKEYDEKENLKSEIPYFKGRTNGIARLYYENGNLKDEGHYVYGSKVEINKEYYESGALKAELSYKNGQKNGTSKIYYETGELQAEILFKNGKAISGDIYGEDGEKMKMTNAHLHAIDNGKLPNIKQKF